jgi:phosphohistidine phosphatase SixA
MRPCFSWRVIIELIALVSSGVFSLSSAQASEQAAWAALKQGAIVLFRHSNAPGVGDPPGMQIGDCKTQRNLDESGREQARRIGAAFRSQGVEVGGVFSSQWCRALETAELAFPGVKRAEPAFNSFFENRPQAAPQTIAARQILQDWRGPGALVVTSHQVNISALTNAAPGSGEGVVVEWDSGSKQLNVIGRLRID